MSYASKFRMVFLSWRDTEHSKWPNKTFSQIFVTSSVTMYAYNCKLSLQDGNRLNLSKLKHNRVSSMFTQTYLIYLSDYVVRCKTFYDVGVLQLLTLQCDITLLNICTLEEVKGVVKMFYQIIWNVLHVGIIKKWRKISMHRAFKVARYSFQKIKLRFT